MLAIIIIAIIVIPMIIIVTSVSRGTVIRPLSYHIEIHTQNIVSLCKSQACFTDEETTFF